MALDCGGKEILKQGLIRRIGTERQTHAWNDNWIPRDYAMRPIACLKQNPPALVAEFINESTAAWDVPKLRQFFLPMDVEVI